MTIGEEEWEFAEELEIEWQQGMFDLSDRHLGGYWEGYPFHIHGELDVGGERFHLDVYGIGEWNSGRSRIDILVYDRSLLVATGSKGNMMMASFGTNLPLTFPTKNGMVIIPDIGRPGPSKKSRIEATYWHKVLKLLEDV
jgi:hypothetical protein